MLLMSSALVAGGDPGCDGCPPAPVSALAGCGCDPCGGGGGPFSKLKSRFGGKPLFFGFGGFKSDDCDPCGSSKPGLLARLKDKLGCHKDEPCPCPAPCDPCGGGMAVSGCALPAVPGVPSGSMSYSQPQMMPQTGVAQPEMMPSTQPGQPQPMPGESMPPTRSAPSAPGSSVPKAEEMPKPAEVKPPTPKGDFKVPSPSSGIPSLEVPRIES